MIALRTIAANVTELVLPEVTVLFSYDTPVAYLREGQWFCTAKKFSVTTSKHVRLYVSEDAIVLNDDVFTGSLNHLTTGAPA